MPEPTPSARTQLAGKILSGLPALLLLASGGAKVVGVVAVKEQLATFGFAPGLPPVIGAIEIGCAILYLVPQTAVLGAILLTGYLGGAVATHVRVGDGQFAPPIILGALVWSGLALRDRRLRELLPLRK
ncbi:MAG: DoxX family protein [Myxococcales bacterium]|nr:DoxX family protein [Myxococcales bacterium]